MHGDTSASKLKRHLKHESRERERGSRHAGTSNKKIQMKMKDKSSDVDRV